MDVWQFYLHIKVKMIGNIYIFYKNTNLYVYFQNIC